MKKIISRKAFMLSFIAFCLLFIIVCTLFSYAVGYIKRPNLPTLEAAPTQFPVIVIDAGHGGEDGGTVGVNGILEKELNLTLAKKLSVFLSALGLRVVLTRNEDILLYDRNADYMGHKKLLDAKERLRIVQSLDNAVFVSIHQNAFSESKYSGAQIYYSASSPQSKQLAALLEDAIRSCLQSDNHRVSKPSSGRIYLLDRISTTAVLVECGFLSNPDECELLCSEDYQNKLCAVLAAAIFTFISRQ